MNICIITSNTCNGREYQTTSKSALNCAKLWGRCDGGEIVKVISPSGKVLSVARWTPENGGKYYRCEI